MQVIDLEIGANYHTRARSKSPRNSSGLVTDFHTSFLKFGLWPEMSYEK